jgi:hypothetical protein
MHLRRGGSVQRSLTSGPGGGGGWPLSLPLQPLMSLLHGHALEEAVTWNLKLEVSGNQTWWSAGRMARLASQHLACSRARS